MWEQNLGVKITIENVEPDKYFDRLYSGQHGQLFSSGWCADYPDPENFADVLFHSGAQQNIGNYSNPTLDTLLNQARTEQNVAKRIQLYQQAEQIIVQDAPALVISHPVSYMLVKPYVKGFVLTPIDIPIERFLSLQH
jgi:oligopeptide transport system substrate-binding protein